MSKAKKALTVILVIAIVSMIALGTLSKESLVSTEHLKYIPSGAIGNARFRAFNVSTTTITLGSLLTNTHTVQYQYEIDNRRYTYVSVNVTYVVTTLDDRILTTGKSSMSVAPFTRRTTVLTIKVPTWTNLMTSDEAYYVRANALIEGLSTADTYIPFRVIYSVAKTQLYTLLSVACLVAVLILNGREILRTLTTAKRNSVAKE